ncbi:MAG: hypothetical protein GXO37_05490 [Chloroflexi bacterium]|nr:hypothetical protein [Chloroflexota bacterium]
MSHPEAVPEGWEPLPDDHPLTRRAASSGPEPELITSVRSLQDLIDRALGRVAEPTAQEDAGLAEVVPFPFLALVGQREMRLALLLAVVHPGLGGVLLVGPPGTGKSAAARGVADILPPVPRSLCYYGCLPEDIVRGGLEAVCSDCARKYQAGQPLAVEDRARFIELSPTVSLDALLGAADPKAGSPPRWRKGLLAQADRHVLYLDELGRYPAVVVDTVLEAVQQGHYTVHRGGLAATYRSRALLIASADPEHATVPRRTLERFALRARVTRLSPAERQTLYHRLRAWHAAPADFAAQYTAETQALRQEVRAARELLPLVRVDDDLVARAVATVQGLGIGSARAEYAWLEAARAHAAAAGRVHVTADDLEATAALALRFRGRALTPAAAAEADAEDERIRAAWEAARAQKPVPPPPAEEVAP